MKTSVIKIGNSTGIIIPKAIAKAYNIEPKSIIDINGIDDKIIIETNVRADWEGKFKAYAENHEESLIDDVFVNEDMEQWQW